MNEIARWADLIMDWEIPQNKHKRFLWYQQQMRIQKLEMKLYGLKHKPMPFHYWGEPPWMDT